MSNHQRRLKTIEVNLTPKQIVILWLKKSQKAGSFKDGCRLVTQNKRAFCPGYPATDIDDFMATPSSLHKCIQENVDATRS
jgi:hypothetical protein